MLTRESSPVLSVWSLFRPGACAIAMAALAPAQNTARFEPLYREALERRQAEFGADDLRTANARVDLAMFLNEQDRPAEAEPLLRAAARLLGFLSLPAILAAHFSGIERAGLVAFAISILSLVGSLFNPLGLLLLPVASNQMAKKDLSLLKLNLNKLLKISLGLTFLIVLFLEAFAPVIIKIYLGREFLEAANIMR
ncbi:MAG: tetratricopeptide repeat protein, partial [candidate division Zixibacteria bacterium]|nr:tetratricopeptide repeat protein [candidate division Zixibacteria bacterium]